MAGVQTFGKTLAGTAMVGTLIGAVPGGIIGGLAGAIDKDDSVAEGMGKGMLIGAGLGITATGISNHVFARKMGYKNFTEAAQNIAEAMEGMKFGMGYDGVGL